MKAATPRQMNAIDRYAIETLGIPSLILMESAASQVVSHSLPYLSPPGRVVLLAGKGNNGGDALAAARQLHLAGFHINIFVIAPEGEFSTDAAIHLEIAEKLQLPLDYLTASTGFSRFQSCLEQADLVIDGLYGTGLKGTVTGPAAQAIEAINASGKPVLAIDIPSGIDGLTGAILGTAIQATETVTFCLPKIGLLLHPGCNYAGQVTVAPISIPTIAIDQAARISTHWIEEGLAADLLPVRPSDSNKGTFGRLLIVTGSPGMTGAGYLAGSAALRSGAGLVYLGVPGSLSPQYNILLPEAITLSFPETTTGHLAPFVDRSLDSVLQGLNALVIGPGLSTADETGQLVASLLQTAQIPLVLDADGLNLLAKDLSSLKGCKAPVIVTPHPGEMARLLDKTIPDVQQNRIEAAAGFAKAHQVTTVLKGSRTVVACPDGSVYLNGTGNAGMATAGTGDVLAGLIGSLLGQGLPPTEAAVLGVYLHGLAGDLAAADLGQAGIIASDLLSYLPKGIGELEQKTDHPSPFFLRLAKYMR